MASARCALVALFAAVRLIVATATTAEATHIRTGLLADRVSACKSQSALAMRSDRAGRRDTNVCTNARRCAGRAVTRRKRGARRSNLESCVVDVIRVLAEQSAATAWSVHGGVGGGAAMRFAEVKLWAVPLVARDFRASRVVARRRLVRAESVRHVAENCQ